MKYIKIFEFGPSEKSFIVDSENIRTLNPKMRDAYDNMKFHIGDLVKLEGWDKFTFTVVDVEIFSEYQPYRLEDNEYKSSTWRNEYEITMAPDYDIAANKYNL